MLQYACIDIIQIINGSTTVEAEMRDGRMKEKNRWISVGSIVMLLFLCVFLTVYAVTGLQKPIFTQVYYTQNNERNVHTIYFYMIDNREQSWGQPFHFCFPERPAVLCTLQPAKQYEQYSVLMEQEKHKWQEGRRYFGRYCVTLLQLQFVIPEEELKNGALQLEQGKFYFTEDYYQDIDLGTVCIYPADTIVSPYQQLPGPRTMTYISTGDFSERPYFSDFGQVWEYVQKNGQIV